ncbi:NAD(P)H-dependent oxidoreductase [Streptococcus tangpeifui]|uniref:NAD(P)H-dependent oxidoreductase n=1 Tax=Streptococcus tangpeifui TaxID=2709400 RepID=UPI0013EE06C7|nr:MULTISPECIES: NAD(P)H-dependent oxidoreductase [unclassified Streptococcus]
MNILMITAHPNPQSFNAYIAKQVQENLNKSHKLRVIDLYAEGFDPILRFDSRHRRRDLASDPETAKYRDLVTWADQFIFIFPIWWSGMPAMLKGFIDRVFVAGFAYHNTKTGLKGHLKGKAWIIITHNTPSFITPLAQDYGKVLKNQILKSCGISPVTISQITGVEKISDQERQKALNKIIQKAKNL